MAPLMDSGWRSGYHSEELPGSLSITNSQSDATTGYITNIDAIREEEYPMLRDATYLDHAGTTLYAKSLIESFSYDLLSRSSLFGNPHSASDASQRTSRRIEDVRLRVLRFFNADPTHFDLVFVENATAGIKLVADAFRDHEDGFWYGYHVDAHTSVIGVRELALQGARCLEGDEDVEEWMSGLEASNTTEPSSSVLGLFSYPGQSNMTGHRSPYRWCSRIRRLGGATGRRLYTLYDAAALVSTARLNLGDHTAAPDFTVCSFYKIFGFPDLGALIVKKSSADVLRSRKYFGGGTVDMVMARGESWHAKKESSIHSRLEDGTLPFHNIIALDSALKVHRQIYGSMEMVARHTSFLSQRLYSSLSSLRHGNDQPVCEIYGKATPKDRGATISFNLLTPSSRYVSKSEVEKLAIVHNIQLRTGMLCNPGGAAKYLNLAPEEMKRNFAAGQRCGDDHDYDVLTGKPTGVIRVSLGAMSSLGDIDMFVNFIRDFYVDASASPISPGVEIVHSTLLPPTPPASPVPPQPSFYIESLAVFPIKSCAAYDIPPDTRWEVRPSGLAWDREWCLVHQGTGVALSQKRYPKMALLKPRIDLEQGVLEISHIDESNTKDTVQTLRINLERASDEFAPVNLCERLTAKASRVCGESVQVQVYISHEVADFFTNALGIPCTLARSPEAALGRVGHVRRQGEDDAPRRRLSQERASHGTSEIIADAQMPGAFPSSEDLSPSAPGEDLLPSPLGGRAILLSNESPILLVSRSSVDQLNTDIDLAHAHALAKSSPGSKALPAPNVITPSSFRGNIVIAERSPSTTHNTSPVPLPSPYVEETWSSMRIHSSTTTTTPASTFSILGPCQRCQMVCVDQTLGARRSAEPYATLARTRRRHGKVWFAVHVALEEADEAEKRTRREQANGEKVWVKVGDLVVGE